jgi:hypothetical protein
LLLALTFLSRLGDTFPVIRVDNEDDALGVLEVYWDERRALERSDSILTVPPQRSDLVLSSDVPDSEGDILVLDSLHVET